MTTKKENASKSSKADAGQAEVQATVGAAEEKGYIGVAADPTPDSHYTVDGVIAGKPTPETHPETAPARAIQPDSSAKRS
jgi:hypothetical protein